MALSFPLVMPAHVLKVTGGEVFRMEDTNIEGENWAGVIQSNQKYPKLWVMQYNLRVLAEADAYEVLAALDVLRSGARAFRAIDPMRRFAINYPNGYDGMTKAGGGSFTGIAKLEAVGEALDTVELSDLPAGFVLKRGDSFSFAFSSTCQALHRVVEGATADGSGEATVTVEPTIVPGFTLDVDVALADPWCKARIVKGSVDQDWTLSRHCRISFNAKQDPRP